MSPSTSNKIKCVYTSPTYPSGLPLLEVESLLGVRVVVPILVVLRVRGAAHEPVLGEQGLGGAHLVLSYRRESVCTILLMYIFWSGEKKRLGYFSMSIESLMIPGPSGDMFDALW